MLDLNSTTAKWVRQHPRLAAVFERLQIDYCCGGDVPLGEACQQRHLDEHDVLAQVRECLEDELTEREVDWLRLPLRELCDHIEQTHHRYLREELPRLDQLIENVVAARAASHSELTEVHQVFRSLRAELEPHMFKEEQILFPAIRHLEDGTAAITFSFGTVANPICMMEQEHETAVEALGRLSQLTDNYAAPEDACVSYHTMLNALQQLASDLHQHIHKENNILFPRAKELEAARNA